MSQEMPRVFITQRPSVKTAQGWADKYDITTAEHFGRLVEILPRGNIPKLVGPTIGRLEDALQDFTDRDYLLMLGDPIAISIASVIAARKTGGILRLLKWDRHQGEYSEFLLDLTAPKSA